MIKCNVLDFSFFYPNDTHDMRFQHEICWSRIYEYPLVLKWIRNYMNTKLISNPKIHNACWGFKDIHIVFKTWLDIDHDNVTHSDIQNSTLYNTEYWDITKKSKYENNFDIVINISTLEEVQNGNHVELINNHLEQLKIGGYFILTFDYPGFLLNQVEQYLNTKIKVKENEKSLTAYNSKLINTSLGLPPHYTCGYLILERIN